MTPDQIVQKSLFLHSFVIDKLRAEPALLESAKTTLVSWQNIASSDSQFYIQKWCCICDSGLDAVVDVLEDTSDYGADMRQCSPFGAVLSPKERWHVLKLWRDSCEKRAS